ncbi:unnamed protein product, partial [Timema podura]|nr:unnamed protein product [Timema podura]
MTQSVRMVALREWAVKSHDQDCELDKPELGTWPPYAFALLLIYFLQQMNNPVLPVLHEMVVPKPGLSEEIVHSDPYLPKRNVSRTVAHVECFDYAMKCLRTAYKYYAIPQIASSIPLFNHITSQGKPINKHISKDIYHILETNPYFQDNVTQDKTMPDYKTLYSVSKEEALLLVKKLNSKYLGYTYSSSKFSGVQVTVYLFHN